MRIGYIWARPIPSRETDTQQVIKTVDALATAGAAVDLIVPRSAAMRRGGMARFEAELREFYGVRAPFRLVPKLGVEPSRLEIERPVHAVVTCVGLRRGEYDVLYGRSRGAAALCALRGQPVVFETYRMLGHDSPGVVRALAWLARRQALLGVVTHSRLAQRSLADGGFPEAKLATIYNGFDPCEMEPRLSRDEARRALGLDPARTIACYTGHVRARKGMDALLALAALTPEVEYLIAGGNPVDVEALTRSCAERGLANVRCLGWRPAAALPQLLYAADVLVIPPSAAPLREHGRTVLPMKLFTYLAAGRPILAPRLPDLEELLSDDNALLVSPDDPASAASALRALLRDGVRAERLAQAALERAAGLTWHARGSALVAQIAAWQAG